MRSGSPTSTSPTPPCPAARPARCRSASCVPQGATGPLPVIVYIHGAGWVFGNAHTHDRLIRELAVGANAAVVFPNYSLSPEAKYPTAIEEILRGRRLGRSSRAPSITSTRRVSPSPATGSAAT